MEVTQPPPPRPAPEPAKPVILSLSPSRPSLPEILASDQLSFHGLARHLPTDAAMAYRGRADIEKYLDGLQAAGAGNIRQFSGGPTFAFGYTLHGHAWVAFRGSRTDSCRNMFVDFVLIDANVLPSGSPRRHRGFLRAWHRIETQIASWMNELPNECRRLVLTGHSLGGALAILAGFHLSTTFPVRAVITFGAPRVGLIRFFNQYSARPSDPTKPSPSLADVTYRYTHVTDIVSRIPPPIFLYFHVGSEHTVSAIGSIEAGPPPDLISRFVALRDRLFGLAPPARRYVPPQFASPPPPEVYVTRLTETLKQCPWILAVPAAALLRLTAVAVVAGALVKLGDFRQHRCRKYQDAFLAEPGLPPW